MPQRKKPDKTAHTRSKPVWIQYQNFFIIGDYKKNFVRASMFFLSMSFLSYYEQDTRIKNRMQDHHRQDIKIVH